MQSWNSTQAMENIIRPNFLNDYQKKICKRIDTSEIKSRSSEKINY